MTGMLEQSKEQDRWDQYGKRQIEGILKNPDKYIIRNSPIGWLAASSEIMRLLGPLEGKRVLGWDVVLDASPCFSRNEGPK
jgi:hypothetical protein